MVLVDGLLGAQAPKISRSYAFKKFNLLMLNYLDVVLVSWYLFQKLVFVGILKNFHSIKNDINMFMIEVMYYTGIYSFK
jgi:hypothetical protein